MDRVKGKVAIVTGAASGIGRAISLLLAKEGAKVVATDINEVGGKRVIEEIRSRGGVSIFVKHDVTSEKDWSEVIKKTLSEFGRVDVLINNAGIKGLLKSIEHTTLEEWRFVESTNLDAVFLGTKHAIAVMKASGGGSIINMSSIFGLRGTLNFSAYTASKGGVRLFTKAAALECSKAGYNYNIRVNSVHPGSTRTPLIEDILKENMDGVLASIPIGRIGEPEDIAYGVLYLASDESTFVTGAELVIDGGYNEVGLTSDFGAALSAVGLKAEG